MEVFRKFFRRFHFRKRGRRVRLEADLGLETVDEESVEFAEASEDFSGCQLVAEESRPVFRLSIGSINVSDGEYDDLCSRPCQVKLDLNQNSENPRRISEMIDVLIDFEVLDFNGREKIREIALASEKSWFSTDLDTCFEDYLNRKCKDPAELRSVLRSPVRVAVNDAAELSCLLALTATVRDLVSADSEAIYYSFCFKRGVLRRDALHCPQCGVCVDSRMIHCQKCQRCCYGLRFGNHCEFCDARSQKSAPSVANLSDLTLSSFDDDFSEFSYSDDAFKRTLWVDSKTQSLDHILADSTPNFDAKSAKF